MSQENWTRDDKLKAKMVTVLMMVAKLLQNAQKDIPLPVEEAALRAAKGYEGLLKTTMQLFPGQSEQMEQEVLEFGKKLGFEVEQIQINHATNTKQ